MYIINNPPINDIMYLNKQINFKHNSNINPPLQQPQQKYQKKINNNKSANNKNITFSSIEQFLHYKMTGRKPHPKVKFTPQEDDLLRNLVQEYGENDNWSIIAKKMTITYRNQRQCKERWFNYLSPKINNTPLTREEDELLEELYAKYGAKWVQIAKFFPSRTDINIRSRWLVLQRRKKKIESKQSGDESETSPISTNLNLSEVQNQQGNRTLNLPVPQIKQSASTQQHILHNEFALEDLNLNEDISVTNIISNNQSTTHLIDDTSNSPLCGNDFSYEDQKNLFNEDNFFNLTPVELTTNDMNSFEDWTF